MILGTRRSELARAQTGVVLRSLRERYPSWDFEERVVKTGGDDKPDQTIAEFSIKGIFVKEIDDLVLSGEIDLAVHSLKDIPTEVVPGLEIAAVLERNGGVDVLVSERSLDELPRGARVGTSSLRRKAQLLRHRADLRPLDVRGNVTTRIRKWRDGLYDGLVLSKAGLLHLGLGVPAEDLDPREFVPAPGQGVIAITARRGSEAAAAARALDHGPTRLEIECERQLLASLGGGCAVPIAARARADRGRVEIQVQILSPDGRRSLGLTREVEGKVAAAEAKRMAEELLTMGGGELLGKP